MYCARHSAFRSQLQWDEWSQLKSIRPTLPAAKMGDWRSYLRALCGATASCSSLLGLIRPHSSYCEHDECGGFLTWQVWLPPSFSRFPREKFALPEGTKVFALSQRVRNGAAVGSQPLPIGSHPAANTMNAKDFERKGRHIELLDGPVYVNCGVHGLNHVMPPPSATLPNVPIWRHHCS